MNQREADEIIDDITARIVARCGRGVSPDTIRDEIRRHFRELEARATIDTYLAVLTERAAMAQFVTSPHSKNDGDTSP